jgi:hypothetical protein
MSSEFGALKFLILFKYFTPNYELRTHDSNLPPRVEWNSYSKDRALIDLTSDRDLSVVV